MMQDYAIASMRLASASAQTNYSMALEKRAMDAMEAEGERMLEMLPQQPAGYVSVCGNHQKSIARG